MISIRLLFVTGIMGIVFASTINTPIAVFSGLFFFVALGVCGLQVYNTITS